MVVPVLPDEVVQLILSFIPVKQRMMTTSLVSQRLREAAAAVTHSISLEFHAARLQRHADSLALWMQHHGHHLTTLKLRLLRQPFVLPWQHLRDLELWVCPMQLAHAATIRGCCMPAQA